MATKTWIIYKTVSASAPGWEERRLMPDDAFTSILAEELDWSGNLPTVGDRVRDYTNLSDPGNGVTHGRDGDWFVSKVEQFSSPDTDLQIAVCLCEYQPIDAQWQAVNRGAPVAELIEAATR
ncbi:MAG: hypothetical protein AAF609_27130 [Cyanobacteria bacterium P01_C01_bin.120]